MDHIISFIIQCNNKGKHKQSFMHMQIMETFVKLLVMLRHVVGSVIPVCKCFFLRRGLSSVQVNLSELVQHPTNHTSMILSRSYSMKTKMQSIRGFSAEVSP